MHEPRDALGPQHSPSGSWSLLGTGVLVSWAWLGIGMNEVNHNWWQAIKRNRVWRTPGRTDWDTIDGPKWSSKETGQPQKPGSSD